MQFYHDKLKQMMSDIRAVARFLLAFIHPSPGLDVSVIPVTAELCFTGNAYVDVVCHDFTKSSLAAVKVYFLVLQSPTLVCYFILCSFNKEAMTLKKLHLEKLLVIFTF